MCPQGGGDKAGLRRFCRGNVIFQQKSPECCIFLLKNMVVSKKRSNFALAKQKQRCHSSVGRAKD